jgi:hypothetical protein
VSVGAGGSEPPAWPFQPPAEVTMTVLTGQHIVCTLVNMRTTTWADAYTRGHNASKRADESGASYEDDDAQTRALGRFVKAFGDGGADAWVTGWNDQAVGNGYDHTPH